MKKENFNQKRACKKCNKVSRYKYVENDNAMSLFTLYFYQVFNFLEIKKIRYNLGKKSAP